MSVDKRSIPNVKVKTIGSGRGKVNMITGILDAPSWNGYFLSEATVYAKEEKFIKDGRIDLSVDGAIHPDGSFEIFPDQVKAYWYLVDQQERIKQAIINKLVEDFPRLLLTEYEYYDLEEGGFPRVSDVVPSFDCKNYIGPRSINIGELVKDDVAYVTWYFNCRWDPEHGFQVVTHKDRIIEIAQDADPWEIYKDNGTYEQEMKNYNQNTAPVPRKEKKWWQFW